MKRLRRKLASMARHSFYDLRRKRRMVFAEWISRNPSDPDLVQNITDIMATGGQIQIQYNGEYKTILPYGWNSSKEGNVLLMCYKDTGEIRSYRLDRVTEVLFDSDNLPPSMQMDSGEQGFGEQSDAGDMGDIPELPDEENDLIDNNQSEESQQELPFDDALEIMDEEVPDEPIVEMNDNVKEEQPKIDEEPQIEQEEKEKEKEVV